MKTHVALLAAVLAVAVSHPAVAKNADCETAPDPVVSLNYVSRYVDDDTSRATIDPLREAEAEAAVAPVDDFIVALADRVDRMYSGPVRSRPKAAECIVSQLAEWADADALSDLETETVRLTVGSRYAAFALILWQTLPYAPDKPARDRVMKWLELRMGDQIVFWQDAAEGARQGNLRAWAGLAAAALSAQNGDHALSLWAERATVDVMCSAAPDGSLPQEMTRGRLALHYQLHAVAPLVTAAALLERQGIPASRDCNGALHRIVRFTLDDLVDGTRTHRITGVEQNFFDGSNQLEAFQLAWIEPYLSLRDDAELAALAHAHSPLSYSKLGGNQTALWGH